MYIKNKNTLRETDKETAVDRFDSGFPIANNYQLIKIYSKGKPGTWVMRQILRGKKSVSQNSGTCRIHFR